jgi:hypothetical protein
MVEGAVSSSIGRAGMRGTLKKPNTSRYSSSLGAGFRVVGGFVGLVSVDVLLVGMKDDEDEVRGCLDIKKSRSKAQRRISARIFTEEGVLRSASVSADR